MDLLQPADPLPRQPVGRVSRARLDLQGAGPSAARTGLKAIIGNTPEGISV